MTVRWKPLLILSGLFVVIAVVGVVAMAYTLLPRGASDILPAARAERAAKKYDNALVHYRRALQKDGKNPEIHEELAGLFQEWAEQAPEEKKAELHGARLVALTDAAKYGKTLIGPRRQLLEDAMQHDEAGPGVYWAKEVLGVEPANADAHYVIAAEALEERMPNIPEIKRDLAALQAARAPAVRIAWIQARIAQLTGDDGALKGTLEQARGRTLADQASPVDRMALLRLRALDVQTTTDFGKVPERVEALVKEASRMRTGPAQAPGRIVRVGLLLEQIQRSLMPQGSSVDPSTQAQRSALVEAIDRETEAIFKKALAASSQPNLQIYLSYADHLRFRGRREECLKVVDEGLKSPAAARKNTAAVVMGLHAVAVETALANPKDPDRLAKATPHIKELIACTFPRYQGLGHLFQGAIDLEQSGAAAATPATSPGERGGEGRERDQALSTPQQARFRVSALNHLKAAATQLPDIAEAQARYGVALVLSKEPGLGRQYLLKAVRQGNLDPQYQVWAAWSMVQAGYPEEAEPIVAHLFDEIAGGRQPKALEGTLHLLSAEIHQARRSPEELKQAMAEYDRAIAAGQPVNAIIQLRRAQIDVQLGQPEQALKRIETLRAQGRGGPAAEQLAVLTLQQTGKADLARTTLDAARRRYPRSEELAGLDAATYIRANQPKEADRVLTAFLAQDPENIGIALMRAQVLADLLDDVKEARKLLVNLAERSDNSAPLVQLALLDLKQRDYSAVSSTIARIRSRWKEAAAADLLEAQLALDQENLTAASASFDAALKKDPNNKMVLFWKAQLDSQMGAAPEAARTLESIVKERPIKELDQGLSLTAAAESALANLALASGDLDAAIQRFEELRGAGGDTLRRSDRWQLVTAYAAKGQWPAATQEMTGLLNDLKSPPTNDERVRAANLYRQHGDEPAAQAQLDAVLKVNPAHPAAVVTRAYLLAEAKQLDAAATLLRQAITQAKEQPPAVFFLMLAAIENRRPPADTAPGRALATIDQGLAVQGEALELVQAKYQLLKQTQDARAALAFVEAKARDSGNDDFRRLLVEVYGEQKDYAGAERILRTLFKKNPKDPAVAANLVRLAMLRAMDAAGRNDDAQRRNYEDQAATLIREFRVQFPTALAFLQLECDLAVRRSDMARAVAITQEMDKVAKNSTAGPLTRARLYAAQGRTREVADAYSEALERNPRQPDVRILLGQTCLKLDQADEALRQARLVLEVDKNQPDALLLQAKALAQQAGPDSQVSARRAQAIAQLWGALKAQPRFVNAYHMIAEIEMMDRHRDKAANALKAGLKAVPEDAAGLASLVEILTEPRDDGRKPGSAELAEAQALAQSVGTSDPGGKLLLALAVGFHKAGQLDLALPWAEKAAAKLDAPVVHLNYGDLLLSVAEATKDPAQARSCFERAVAQYDLVLKTQERSVEAINNKAWILHTHLGDSRAALDLALGLLKRSDPALLPGEFFDTLGTVQQATGRTRDAEMSYAEGLRKAPDHAVLNYHMGKLLLAEHNRKALPYLERAYANRSRLSPKVADEVATLMKQATRE
jgi:predicted Zn-dependent protease